MVIWGWFLALFCPHYRNYYVFCSSSRRHEMHSGQAKHLQAESLPCVWQFGWQFGRSFQTCGSERKSLEVHYHWVDWLENMFIQNSGAECNFITLRKGSRQLPQRISHSKHIQSLQQQNPASSRETKTGTSFSCRLDWGFLVLLYRIVHSAVLRSTSLKEQLYRLRRRMWAPDSAIKLQEVWEGWTPNISLNERRHQMPCILPNFGVLDRCHLWTCLELPPGQPSNIFTAARAMMPQDVNLSVSLHSSGWSAGWVWLNKWIDPKKNMDHQYFPYSSLIK